MFEQVDALIADKNFAQKIGYTAYSMNTLGYRWRSFKKLCDNVTPKPASLMEAIGSRAVEIISSTGCSGTSYAPGTKLNLGKMISLLRREINESIPDDGLELALTSWLVEDMRRPKTNEDVESIKNMLNSADLDPLCRGALLVKILLEVPVRDDLQLLHIQNLEPDYEAWVSDMLISAKKNLIFEERDASGQKTGRWAILIAKTKNIAHRKSRYYLLSPELSAELTQYCEHEGLFSPRSNIYMFGNCKHSRLVGEVLRYIGIKNETCRGSINLIRQAVANSAKRTGDATIIAKTALNSFHTIATTKLSYEHN